MILVPISRPRIKTHQNYDQSDQQNNKIVPKRTKMGCGTEQSNAWNIFVDNSELTVRSISGTPMPLKQRSSGFPAVLTCVRQQFATMLFIIRSILFKSSDCMCLYHLNYIKFLKLKSVINNDIKHIQQNTDQHPGNQAQSCPEFQSCLQDELFCLAISFLLVQALRFQVTGVLATKWTLTRLVFHTGGIQKATAELRWDQILDVNLK